MALRAVFAAALSILATSSGVAASLQVSPVTVEVPQPGAASTISLRNEGATQLSAQVRVFRWSQVDGMDRLDPTSEVVASPPAVTISPRSDYTIRIIRLKKEPVASEESYRLVIDELPDPNRLRNGAINLVVRYSIPVFFTAADAAAPRLTWSVESRGGRSIAVARNAGGRRLRLSALHISDAAGHAVSYGDGLAGYVLAGSTMRFVAPRRLSEIASGTASVTATSDLGALHATAPIQK